jgi:hypothetical protein
VLPHTLSELLDPLVSNCGHWSGELTILLLLQTNYSGVGGLGGKLGVGFVLLLLTGSVWCDLAKETPGRG